MNLDVSGLVVEFGNVVIDQLQTKDKCYVLNLKHKNDEAISIKRSTNQPQQAGALNKKCFIIGPSGSGKTTYANSISKLISYFEVVRSDLLSTDYYRFKPKLYGLVANTQKKWFVIYSHQLKTLAKRTSYFVIGGFLEHIVNELMTTILSSEELVDGFRQHNFFYTDDYDQQTLDNGLGFCKKQQRLLTIMDFLLDDFKSVGSIYGLDIVVVLPTPIKKYELALQNRAKPSDAFQTTYSLQLAILLYYFVADYMKTNYDAKLELFKNAF